MISISIIIPTRNEAGGIVRIIDAVRAYGDEIIVIDGRSEDNTVELAQQAGAQVWTEEGHGKGAAYKTGLKRALGEVVVFIDADGSHKPADIPRLVEPILQNKADLVIASRHRGGSDEWQGDLDTYLRHLGSGILTLVINYRWGVNLTDCLNGFRAIRREVGLNCPLLANNFDIEQHMIAQCLKHGYRVKEIGSHEYCRAWGQSKLPTYRKVYLFFWRLLLDLMLPPDQAILTRGGTDPAPKTSIDWTLTK